MEKSQTKLIFQKFDMIGFPSKGLISEKKMNRIYSFLALTFMFISVSFAAPGGPGINPVSIGFEGMVMFVADGEYIPASPNPDVPGCFMGLCDQDFFWNEIGKVSPEEVAMKEIAAKTFFLNRFGLEVDFLSANGTIAYLPIYADPRINYRARFVAGKHVHPYGWEVHDPAFLVVTQQDLVLGGEWEGVEVPPGTIFSFGEYWIQKSRLIKVGRQPKLVKLNKFLVIKYQSSGPIPPPGIHGLISSNCEVTESPWGKGIAQVVGGFDITDTSGTTLQKQNLRNVLTFDDASGLGLYPGYYNE